MSAENIIKFGAVAGAGASLLLASDSNAQNIDAEAIRALNPDVSSNCIREGTIEEIDLGDGRVATLFRDGEGDLAERCLDGAVVAQGNGVTHFEVQEVPGLLPQDNYSNVENGVKIADARLAQAEQDQAPEAVVAQLAGNLYSGETLEPTLVETNADDEQVARMLGILGIQNPTQVAEIIPSTELEFRNRAFYIVDATGAATWRGFDRTEEEPIYQQVNPEDIDEFFGIQTRLVAQETTNVRPYAGTGAEPVSIVNAGELVNPVGPVVAAGGLNWQGIELSDGIIAYIADANQDGVFGTSVRALSPDAVMTPEAILASYRWQEGDIVNLISTGRGTPDQVSEHWQLSIQRGERTYDNLPVTEMEYGGRVRPLQVKGRYDVRQPDVLIDYEMEGVYLGQDTTIENIFGTPTEVRGLILAVPSSNGQDTIVIRAVSPATIGFSIGGSRVDVIETSDAFEQIPNVIKPGAQITIYTGITEPNEYLERWIEVMGVDCEADPICLSWAYAFDQSLSTTPHTIYEWFQSNNLDEERVVREGGIVRVGGLDQIIISRAPGTVY